MKKLAIREKQKARRVADMLMDAFIWGDTPDGNGYWSEVHVKLTNYAKGSKERRHVGDRRDEKGLPR